MADDQTPASHAPSEGNPDYPLPLGSVVILSGAQHPVMIIARCLRLRTDAGEVLIDYGAAPWPQGLVGDQVIYFDAPSIERVVMRGYVDELGEESLLARQIAEAAATSQLPRRGDVAATGKQVRSHG